MDDSPAKFSASDRLSHLYGPAPAFLNECNQTSDLGIKAALVKGLERVVEPVQRASRLGELLFNG